MSIIDNIQEVLCAGSLNLDFDTNLSEVSVGNLNVKKIGDCKVYVYSKEGQIPHFHIISDNYKGKYGNKFECCVKIYESDYFSHTGKEDKLNDKQAKQLDDWLKNISFNGKNTNWELITTLWAASNETMKKFDKDAKKPDYSNLNKSK